MVLSKRQRVEGHSEIQRRTIEVKKPMSFHVYFLLLQNNSIYVGFTDDLDRRFQEHLNGTGAKATRESKPVKIIHTESFPNRTEALTRERP
jgi:putative endonuclease